MVAMAVLCGTRIRYFCLLVHLVDGDLAGSIEEDGDSSSRGFHGVAILVQSTYFTSFVLEASDQFKGSTAMILALGRWSLGARPRRLPDCQQQCQRLQDGSGDIYASAARSSGSSSR
jgi:hypothetical protein